jgi:hypothetical protein
MPLTPGAGTAAQQGSGAAATDEGSNSIHHEGRKKLPWSKEIWERIDKAVEMEMKRVLIGRRFISQLKVSHKTLTVPTDAYALGASGFTVDEGASTRLITLYVPFSLTPQQIAQESADTRELGHSTAVTLATRAANALAQAEDLLIFQGQNGYNNPLFVSGTVVRQGTPADTGLLNLPIGGAAAGPLAPPVGIQLVAAGAGVPRYGTGAFGAVTTAISNLVATGNNGPYAAVFDTLPYADSYTPIADLAVTADSIRPLMTAGFFGSMALRPYGPPVGIPPVAVPIPVPPYWGVVISLGGNTVDLVVGLHATTAILQEDTQGNFQLQVIERIALRFKNTPGVYALQFN